MSGTQEMRGYEAHPTLYELNVRYTKKGNANSNKATRMNVLRIYLWVCWRHLSANIVSHAIECFYSKFIKGEHIETTMERETISNTEELKDEIIIMPE